MGRYDSSPKVDKGKVLKPVREAKDKAEETASGKEAPGAADDKGVAKIGSDPGVSAGEDATWGKVADRHGSERKEMLARHKAEHEQMIGRHHEEHQKIAKRHEKELSEASEAPKKMETTAEADVKKDAENPKELGQEKHIDGTKGEEP